MTENKLSKNLEYVQKNFDSLLNLYRNKFILVHDEQVVGSFDSYENAAEGGINTYGIKGNFLVYQMTSEKPINYVSTVLI